jgi:hypothetical protein
MRETLGVNVRSFTSFRMTIIKKPCAEKRMAEMPVRLGPPFGGITRIRFKGFVYDVSAIRLPRTTPQNTAASDR